MKARFRMFRRGNVFWCQDNVTAKQETLGTRDRETALRLLHARNEAGRQTAINLQIARAYLAASDPEIATRKWQLVMEEMAKIKQGPTRERWLRAIKDKAFDSIRDLSIIETRSEHFLRVLEVGKVSSNVFLRRIHNFALDMTWLPWPVLPKKRWPVVKFKEKRAITWAEHEAVVAREGNTERNAFYQLAWHLGASQSDLAHLQAENIDWQYRVIAFARKKTGSIALMRFGDEVAELLRSLPASGPLFPYLRRVRANDRATEFRQRCQGLGIHGVSLHSYRYAWAERAKRAGYPERFAQEALGHNSKAVHRSYAKKAHVAVPSLADYEKQSVNQNLIPLRLHQGAATRERPVEAKQG